MLIVERMLIIAHELEYVAQVELNEVMELVYDLQMVKIFVFVDSLLFYSEENNKLHQKLLYLFI